MNITLFGAAFDPPHLGHQTIAVNLLVSKKTEAVWFVPVKEHPFGKQLAPEGDRLAMVRLLAQNVLTAVQTTLPHLSQEEVRVETFELDEPGISYTHRTLTTLAAQYPEHTFSFVVGSDNLPTFNQWDEYQEMLSQFPFFVYPRHGYPMEPFYPGMVALSEMAEIRVSSTQVRQLLAQGLPIKDFVSPEVNTYIHQHQLYQQSTELE